MSKLSKRISLNKVTGDENYILRKAMKQFYLDNMLNNSKSNSIPSTNCKAKMHQNVNTSITDFINEKYTGELLSFIYSNDSFDI